MEERLFIPVLLGTVREGRQSEKVARYMVRRTEAYGGIETMLIDPRDLHLPMTDEGKSLGDRNPVYRDAIAQADGLIIVAPEYNHGYPGSLKRTLDLVRREYTHKPVGLCGVSAGMFGGGSAALVGLVENSGMGIDKLGSFATMFVDFAKEKAGADLVGKIMDGVPDLKKVLG